MKLRNAAAATVAAFALALSMPGTAVAAQGQFHYKYVDDMGRQQSVTLHDPSSGECINLYATGDDDALPGYGPHNDTDSVATVYFDVDCEGDQWHLRPHGKPARDDLEMRSVRFGFPG
ncbi:hypothetical protein [Streptomyces albidochromogenes]|uniref:Secreted protein n=1 Tax=Streptomyces albidochromogenes TaxID=329524 RepID=A0ABW6FF77_9ACTN